MRLENVVSYRSILIFSKSPFLFVSKMGARLTHHTRTRYLACIILIVGGGLFSMFQSHLFFCFCCCLVFVATSCAERTDRKMIGLRRFDIYSARRCRPPPKPNITKRPFTCFSSKGALLGCQAVFCYTTIGHLFKSLEIV